MKLKPLRIWKNRTENILVYFYFFLEREKRNYLPFHFLASRQKGDIKVIGSNTRRIFYISGGCESLVKNFYKGENTSAV